MKVLNINLDILGVAASMLCAIHCLLLPFLLTFGTVGGLAWMENPLFEWIIILTSIFLACLSLFQSYRFKHRNSRPFLIVSIGFSLLFFSQLTQNHSVEHLIMAFGGIIIASAHLYNWKLSKKFPEAVRS